MGAAAVVVRDTSVDEVQQGIDTVTKVANAGRAHVRRATSAVKSGMMRAGLRRRLHPPRLLPRRWGERPGASVIAQVGASARLPLQPAAVLQRVRSAQSMDALASEDSNTSLGRSLLAPVQPVLRGVRVQPIARLRAEATLGMFRRYLLDHTSVTAEIEGALRQRDALGLPECRAEEHKSHGLTHLVSCSVKQQVFGPIRAFADLRWELSACGGQEHAEASRSSTALRMGHLRPKALDRVLGVDWCLGFASVAAWYSPLRQQGLVELRI